VSGKIYHIVPKLDFRWGLLAIICLYNFAVTLTFQSIPPVLSLIVKDIGINYAQAGFLMSFYTLPGMIIAVPISFLYPRIGTKKLGLISLLILAIGSALIIAANSFPILLLGRIILGIGASALPIVGSQAVAKIFMNYRLGLAIGIYGIAMPLSTVIPFFVFGAVAELWGWKSSILITLIVVVITFIIIAVYFKMPGEEPDKATDNKILSASSFTKMGMPLWVLASSWAFFLVAHMSLLTFMPDFIYSRGTDLALAGSLTGIIMLCSVFINPFVGYLLDLTRRKELYIIIGSGMGCVLLFLLVFTDISLLAFVILLGIITAPLPIAVNAIIPLIVKHELMAVAYALNFMLSSLGMFIGPYISGVIRDYTGSYNFSFYFMALFFLLSALAAVLVMRWTGKKKPVIS